MKLWHLVIFIWTSLSPLAALQYQQSIDRALGYFKAKRNGLKPGAVIALDFLSRNYGIRFDTRQARRELLKSNPVILRPTLRVINYQYELSQLEISTLKGIRSIMGTAMYCDRYAIPWDYASRLRDLAVARDGYAAHWGLQALAIISWQGCKFDVEAAAELRATLAEKSREVIRREKSGSANWMDALLALYLAGKSDWITGDMIKHLIAKQAPAGGWENNDDLTAKALWILLLAADPQRDSRKPDLFRKTDY